MKRIGSAMLASVVGVAAVVLATSQPALAATSVNLPLSSWAYLDSQSPKTKFVNPAVAPPVGTILDDANKAHTYRSYFTYDLTQLKGAVVHSSYLYTYEDTVTDCSTAATIELWRTAPVKAGTTWNNPPAELDKLISVNRGRRCLLPRLPGHRHGVDAQRRPRPAREVDHHRIPDHGSPGSGPAGRPNLSAADVELHVQPPANGYRTASREPDPAVRHRRQAFAGGGVDPVQSYRERPRRGRLAVDPLRDLAGRPPGPAPRVLQLQLRHGPQSVRRRRASCLAGTRP